MDEALVSLISLFQNSAPELWRIATLRVETQNIVDIVFIFVFALLTVISLVLRDYYKDDYDYDTIANFLGIVFSSFFVVGIVLNVMEIYLRVSNPEYYALKVLLDLVK